MKHRMYAVVFITICQLMVGAAAYADISTGFGGLAWSSAPDPNDDCELITRKADLYYCARQRHAHTLLGEPVARVTYGYYRDQFFAVFMRIENDDLQEQAKRTIIEHFGSPETQINKEGKTSAYRWKIENVAVEIYEDSSETGFQLAYYYLPVADKASDRRRLLFPPKRPKAKLFPFRKDEIPEALRILEF